MGKRKEPSSEQEDDGHVTNAGSDHKRKKQAGESEEEEATPYPDFDRPSAEECVAACKALADLHGLPENPFRRQELDSKDVKAVQSALGQVTESQRTVMDSLVRTILSQNTTDTNSHRTFAALKEAFPTWEDVRQASDEDIIACIKSGGLANTKTQRIKAILDRLVEERGAPSLEYLRELPDDEIKKELTKFKGIGKKTVACVLMFCLGSHEFPVDTHVWRITKKMGWVPNAASREQCYDHLNARVPPSVKYDLHVLLVQHGKSCTRCAKNGHPRKEVVGPCPLTDTRQLAKQLAAKGEDLGVPERAEAVLGDGPGSTAKPSPAGKQEAGSEQKADAEGKSSAEQKPAVKGRSSKSQVKSEPGAEPGKPAARRRTRQDAKTS